MDYCRNFHPVHYFSNFNYFSSSYSYIFYYKHSQLTDDDFGFFFIIQGILNIYDKKTNKS